MAKEIYIYEAADKAIQMMNRDSLREFGKLKLTKWDELNVIQRGKNLVRQALGLYRDQAKKAKRRFYEIACEAYLIGLYLCDVTGRDAADAADGTIVMDWVEGKLDAVNEVTKFSYNAETDRKAQRLLEALTVSNTPDAEIDRALRAWSKQNGQYAIGITDAAVKQAYEDAGVEMVQWVTAQDERVCEDCNELDGQVFPIGEVPQKPHWGCRCYLRPVK